MTTLDDRFEKGLAMRTSMAGGDRSHFTLPGIDQLAPDLKRIIEKALFGSFWIRPALMPPQRVICTISALVALGQLPLLKRHIERGLNTGLTPAQVVEVFIQVMLYGGYFATRAALRIASSVFTEQGITS